MPAPDPEFTRYAETGDASAFRALVTAHLPMVHAVAWRRLGEHAHLAPDVSQAVFTRLARSARGLPRDLVPAAWLHRQAVRRAIDTVRSETRRRHRETTAAAAMLSSRTDDSSGFPASAGPAPAPVWQQIAPLLDEAMDRLPAADRAALVLRYLEDRDFAAVGSALKTTPEAARKRVSRSLEKLRVLLGRRGVAVPAAALAACLSAQTQSQAQAQSQAQSQLASAALSAATISQTALTAAASGGGGAGLLAVFLMSHLTSVTAGAAAVLLAAGLFYQHQETEIRRRLSSTPSSPTATLPAVLSGPAPSASAAPMADDEGPKTLAEIITALEKLTRAPETRLTKLRIAALLRKIPPGKYLEFYTAGESVIDRRHWFDLVNETIGLWMSADPQAVILALCDSNNRKEAEIGKGIVRRDLRLNGFMRTENAQGHDSMRSMFGLAFQAWLKRDFSAALQWAESAKESPFLRIPLAEGTVHSGLLLSAVPLIPEGRDIRDFEALRGYYEPWAVARVAAGDPVADVLALAEKPEDIRAVAANAAMTRADEVREWVESAPVPGGRFEGALGLVAMRMRGGTGMDPAQHLKEADFALENAGPMPRGEALRAIADAWMNTSGGAAGFDEFRAWLSASGTPEETAAAMEMCALRMARSGSRNREALAFAGELPDPALRESLQRGIFLRGYDQDPRNAREFLKTAAPDLVNLLTPILPADQP